MGSMFNKAKSSSIQKNFQNQQYQDDNKVELSGIQFVSGVVIEDETDESIFVLADGFKDVAFSLNYETNIFKLSKHAKFEIALSHQLRLETYQAVKAWGESPEASDEVTLLEISEDEYPTAGDYYSDPTIRAVFVKLAKTEGTTVTEDVVSKGKSLFAKAKR